LFCGIPFGKKFVHGITSLHTAGLGSGSPPGSWSICPKDIEEINRLIKVKVVTKLICLVFGVWLKKYSFSF
jgi:hypothetical protein